MCGLKSLLKGGKVHLTRTGGNRLPFTLINKGENNSAIVLAGLDNTIHIYGVGIEQYGQRHAHLLKRASSKTRKWFCAQKTEEHERSKNGKRLQFPFW